MLTRECSQEVKRKSQRIDMLKYDSKMDRGGTACASSVLEQLGYLREGLEEMGRRSRAVEGVQALVCWMGRVRWVLGCAAQVALAGAKEEIYEQEVRLVGVGLSMEKTRLHSGRRAYWFGDTADKEYEGFGGVEYGKKLKGGVAVVVRALGDAKVRAGKGRRVVGEDVVLSGEGIDRLKPWVQESGGELPPMPEGWKRSWLKCEVLRHFPFWYREEGVSFYNRVGLVGVGCATQVVVEGFGGSTELSVVVKGGLVEEGRTLWGSEGESDSRLVRFCTDVGEGFKVETAGDGDWLGTYLLLHGGLRRVLEKVRLLGSMGRLRAELGAMVRVIANRSSVWLVCTGDGAGVAWVMGWHEGDKEYENPYGTLVVGWPEGSGDFPAEYQLNRLGAGLVATPVKVWGGGREFWLEGSLEGEVSEGMRAVREWVVAKAVEGYANTLTC